MHSELGLNDNLKSPNNFMVDEFRRFLSTKSVPKKTMPIKPSLQIVVAPNETISVLGVTSPLSSTLS
jgi:hypothetical protein